MLYQLGWATLPGLRGLSCSGFRAAPTETPDYERGVAVEFTGDGERDEFLREIEAAFAARRFSNPARFNARLTRSPDTLCSMGISMRDFDGRPEGRRFSRPLFGNAPSLEIEFDGFAEVGAGPLTPPPQRRHAQYRATREVPAAFF